MEQPEPLLIRVNADTVEHTNQSDLIKQKITTLRNQIVEYDKYITSAKKEIIELEKGLYKVCDHYFIRDSCVVFDDIFKYKCTKCNLYKNYY